ncbi:MAG: 50S ribosomal protein L29 [Candidatus Omnitrophica bacterium]|nr:50S ribosomal protein L29 [Candidatus Omnitrophota bacterium]MCB9747655.1 50S ribosomal protein L29 [Candidatus Omnitrophota bacterium]
MKAKDYRGLSVEELMQKEKALKKDLFDLHYQRQMGNVEKPGMFKKNKKDIARILTIIREREIEDERNKQSSK